MLRSAITRCARGWALAPAWGPSSKARHSAAETYRRAHTPSPNLGQEIHSAPALPSSKSRWIARFSSRTPMWSMALIGRGRVASRLVWIRRRPGLDRPLWKTWAHCTWPAGRRHHVQGAPPLGLEYAHGREFIQHEHQTANAASRRYGGGPGSVKAGSMSKVTDPGPGGRFNSVWSGNRGRRHHQGVGNCRQPSTTMSPEQAVTTRRQHRTARDSQHSGLHPAFLLTACALPRPDHIATLLKQPRRRHSVLPAAAKDVCRPLSRRVSPDEFEGPCLSFIKPMTTEVLQALPHLHGRAVGLVGPLLEQESPRLEKWSMLVHCPPPTAPGFY